MGCSVAPLQTVTSDPSPWGPGCGERWGQHSVSIRSRVMSIFWSVNRPGTLWWLSTSLSRSLDSLFTGSFRAGGLWSGRMLPGWWATLTVWFHAHPFDSSSETKMKWNEIALTRLSLLRQHSKVKDIRVKNAGQGGVIWWETGCESVASVARQITGPRPSGLLSNQEWLYLTVYFSKPSVRSAQLVFFSMVSPSF